MILESPGKKIKINQQGHASLSSLTTITCDYDQLLCLVHINMPRAIWMVYRLKTLQFQVLFKSLSWWLVMALLVSDPFMISSWWTSNSITALDYMAPLNRIEHW